jgi:hypothetical protein
LHVNDLSKNLDYFTLLIDSVKRDLSPDEGISLIYNRNERILNLDKRHVENVPSFVEQADANCFVKCFEPGFRMRLGKTRERLCEQLMSFDRDNANLLAKRCEEHHQHDLNGFSSRFASLARQDDVNRLHSMDKTRLQEQLKSIYQQHYRYLSSFMTGWNRNPLTEKYVPLQFKREDTLIELEDFFFEPRVLVLGEAGCGKTTVCQYVTYSWACAGMWQHKFEWLFYIKWRNLNSKLYPPQQFNNYSLIDIIEKECFQGYTLTDLDKLKLRSQLVHPTNILWILDGCDERTIPDHLHSVERELLAKPYLLLTSRPYEINNIEYDVKVEIQRFEKQDIERYIKRYFSMFRTTASECWLFILSSEQLLQTAHIPACLEIICSLWDSSRKNFGSDMTIGQLYQKMCEYLLQRYLLKFHGQCPSALAGRDIYQEPNAMAFTHMEHLAFIATQSNRFRVTGDNIKSVAGPLFRSVLQIGLLIPSNQNPSPILDDNIYYFVHRSFQEYLCARYMIRTLTSSCSKEQEKEVFQFITYEKYNRHVQHTFRLFFELKRTDSCTNQFWSAVDSEPRDLVGLRHFSRISQWFPLGTCALSTEDELKVNMRTTDAIIAWISRNDRLAHDYANTYLFDWFDDVLMVNIG